MLQERSICVCVRVRKVMSCLHLMIEEKKKMFESAIMKGYKISITSPLLNWSSLCPTHSLYLIVNHTYLSLTVLPNISFIALLSSILFHVLLVPWPNISFLRWVSHVFTSLAKHLLTHLYLSFYLTIPYPALFKGFCIEYLVTSLVLVSQKAP